jgi:hypothetical protein
MNTPLRLESESEKAWIAFDAYAQMGETRSIRKCARQLNKSTTILARYSKKHRWLKRIAAQQRRECEQKIQAEKKATEAVAVITETEKAAAWRDAFVLAARFLEHASKIFTSSPGNAATLTKVAFTILDSVRGGVAGGFKINVGVVNEAVKQFPAIAFDDAGKPVKEVDFIRSYEQALAIIDAGETAQELPCDNWSKDSPDATPVFTPEEPDEPDTSRAREPKQRTVPSRMGEECPTGDDSKMPFHQMLGDIHAPDI